MPATTHCWNCALLLDDDIRVCTRCFSDLRPEAYPNEEAFSSLQAGLNLGRTLNLAGYVGNQRHGDSGKELSVKDTRYQAVCFELGISTKTGQQVRRFAKYWDELPEEMWEMREHFGAWSSSLAYLSMYYGGNYPGKTPKELYEIFCSSRRPRNGERSNKESVEASKVITQEEIEFLERILRKLKP